MHTGSLYRQGYMSRPGAALRGSLAGLTRGLSHSLLSPPGQHLQKSGVTSLRIQRG